MQIAEFTNLFNTKVTISGRTCTKNYVLYNIMYVYAYIYFKNECTTVVNFAVC